MRALPIPDKALIFNSDVIYPVRYEEALSAGKAWAKRHAFDPFEADRSITLLLIDCQITFCNDWYELYVPGAIKDVERLKHFIYENVANITAIACTLDTHPLYKISHSLCWVDREGNHPPPYTEITLKDVESGVWKGTELLGDGFVRHYLKTLAEKKRYPLMIFPCHGIEGSVGNALVPCLEEAITFWSGFHDVGPYFLRKGMSPYTERYSAFTPEVEADEHGWLLDSSSEEQDEVLDVLNNSDAVIIAGQAKSHCVAWTIRDLCEEIMPDNVKDLYLLEDCTSPVQGFKESAEQMLQAFQTKGLNIVQSTTPMSGWINPLS